LDVIVAVSIERCDEEGGMVVKGIVTGDGEKEVFVDILLLWAPDFLTAFVDNGILVGVVGDSSGAGWGSEEVREELGFWGKGEWEVRKDRSGWGRGGDNSDRSFSDGQQEVFYWDVGKWDTLNNFFKLKVDVGVLVLKGQGILKLGAYNVSLLGGDVSKNVEKVRWGHDGGQGWGAMGVEM
jgi:hypothetical protein